MRVTHSASERSDLPWSAYTLEQEETKFAKFSRGSGTLVADVVGVVGGLNNTFWMKPKMTGTEQNIFISIRHK